jgi:hypothetical protein
LTDRGLEEGVSLSTSLLHTSARDEEEDFLEEVELDLELDLDLEPSLCL